VKLVLMSDLHLEFWSDISRFIKNIADSTPKSDLIVLAGDIGVLACNYNDIVDLLTRLSNKGQVLYVAGNHEFYGRAFECGEQDLERLKIEMRPYRNVHVNLGLPEWIKFGDYDILAGTMWFEDNLYTHDEKSWLSDFRVKNLESYIYRYNTYFKNLLEQTNKANIITISHHSPTFKSTNKKYEGSSLNRFFCNPFDNLLEKVTLACHGHLHDAVDYKLGNTRVISNPLGYSTEMKADWAPKVIELP
jgi:Icc-related predicted phosphoesterase